MKVHILSAIYSYEGETLIGVYADHAKATKKKDWLEKRLERHRNLCEANKEPNWWPEYMGSSLHIQTVKVIP